MYFGASTYNAVITVIPISIPSISIIISSTLWWALRNRNPGRWCNHLWAGICYMYMQPSLCQYSSWSSILLHFTYFHHYILLHAEVAEVTVRGAAAARPRKSFYTRSISDPGLIPLLIASGVSFGAIQVGPVLRAPLLVTSWLLSTLCSFCLAVHAYAGAMHYFVQKSLNTAHKWRWCHHTMIGSWCKATDWFCCSFHCWQAAHHISLCGCLPCFEHHHIIPSFAHNVC